MTETEVKFSRVQGDRMCGNLNRRDKMEVGYNRDRM